MFNGNRFHGWNDKLIEGVTGVVGKLAGEPEHREGQRPKFVGYNELLKILEMKDCPVCFMIRRSIRYTLSVEFIEELTVPEFREPVRASLGFCKEHSEYVRRAARNNLQAMGIAIVYEDLLHIHQEAFNEGRIISASERCPLCSLQQDIESYALQLVADYCDDQEFQQHYERAGGVCLPHLQEILLMTQGTAHEFLVQSHVGKIQQMTEELDEFIRKHDYRFKDEAMTEGESHSWQYAVRFVTGSSG